MFREPQINLYVSDVEASVRFYTELFGFTETFRTPVSGTPSHVEVRLDGFTLGVASFDAARDHHGVDAGSGPSRAEIALWTDDVDRDYADLVERGVKSITAPHDFIGRLRAAWLADPDGTPIQIVTEHPTSTS
ncbi:MAG: VOC family protein [Nitrolancea sp.]